MNSASSPPVAMAESEDGLICAYRLDGAGGGQRLSWSDLAEPLPAAGFTWLHCDYTAPAVRSWLRDHSGLGEVAVAALVADDVRPRSAVIGDGLQVNLRGVNLNPQSDPEDMVSIRLWIEPGRIISTRRRRMLSIGDLQAAILAGRGPANSGEFLVQLLNLLSDRIADVVEEVDEAVDLLQARVLQQQNQQLRSDLAAVRRQIVGLRRYLSPQREGVARLFLEKLSWLREADRLALREIADRTTRFVEDLDAARERASLAQEELTNELSEQLNHRMYVLSMVAAIFLPLGFITGLLGINVGGMPGADAEWAFYLVCLFLAIGVLVQVIWFRRRNWF